MRNAKKILIAAFLFSALTRFTCAAEEQAIEVSRSNLPPYNFPYPDGLYATVAGALSARNTRILGEQEIKLSVPGFCQPLPVKAVVQYRPAPLVVVLLGVHGQTEDAFSKVWRNWYAEAGYNVLSFDSTFLPSFNSKSRHGTTGNVWLEAEKVADVIAAYLHNPSLGERVTHVGVVGMSYGATEAMMLGQYSLENKLPFHLAGIQAWSPVMSMERTAEILDKWYSEERPKYKLIELQPMASHKPSPYAPNSPFSQSMLKAGISTVFRFPLPGSIVYNDDKYNLHILMRGNQFDDAQMRLDHATTFTFNQFAFNVSYPYWERRIPREQLTQMIRAGEIFELLKHQPPQTELIVAIDDPFNAPADVAHLESVAPKHRVTILPSGGHLGYVNEPWTRAKLLTLFAQAGQLTSK